MDIEFHYYMTYLIAARAGLRSDVARTIAHSAQSVDDNHIKYRIGGAQGGDYANYISQTMNILKPTSQLLRLYPIFHFIPGDPKAPTARRLDGREDGWVTTPDSPLARRMIDAALASGDPYRIGVSAHGYVDTWAHQNFLGRRDSFNDMPGAGFLATLLNVGHGAASHKPDHPALIWTDPRLVDSRVDNRNRFLDAAEALFLRLARHVDPASPEASLAAAASLRNDLDADIGPPDPHDDPLLRAARIARYRRRALSGPYGGLQLLAYDEYAWFNAAVAEDGAHLRQGLDEFLSLFADYVDQTTAIPCSWRDPSAYRQTDWYRFVEAVKAHQNACWDILAAEDLDGLDAKGM